MATKKEDTTPTIKGEEVTLPQEDTDKKDVPQAEAEAKGGAEKEVPQKEDVTEAEEEEEDTMPTLKSLKLPPHHRIYRRRKSTVGWSQEELQPLKSFKGPTPQPVRPRSACEAEEDQEPKEKQIHTQGGDIEMPRGGVGGRRTSIFHSLPHMQPKFMQGVDLTDPEVLANYSETDLAILEATGKISYDTKTLALRIKDINIRHEIEQQRIQIQKEEEKKKKKKGKAAKK